MVEGAIAIGVLFLIIGGIIDFGFALYRYNFLNYTTTRSAREISAKLAVTKRCGEIERYLLDVASKEMTNAMQAGAKARWTWAMPVRGSGPKGSLYNFQLTGTMPFECYFVCSMIPSAWTLHTTVSAALESADVFCDAGGPVP